MSLLLSGRANRGASVLADQMRTARVGMALLRANLRYWSTVAPVVRRELAHWERRAQAIVDPALRALALEKLRTERFNAEVAATLATLAPRAQRKRVVQAMVALELLFDYLDGRTEQPMSHPLRDGERLFAALTDAIDMRDRDRRSHRRQQGDDGGYLEELSSTVRNAVARLPAADAIAQVAQASAARCAQAQIRAHAAPRIGTAQLAEWAMSNAAGTDLDWREFTLGAIGSALALHALIAAATDGHTTNSDAVQLEQLYFSIGVTITLLDSLIDYHEDLAAGKAGHAGLYEDGEALALTLANAARRAETQAHLLPNGSHHMMTLIGVVAYFTSAPGASSEQAAPVMACLNGQLQPWLAPTLALMRLWRAAKRMRRRPPADDRLTEMTH